MAGWGWWHSLVCGAVLLQLGVGTMARADSVPQSALFAGPPDSPLAARSAFVVGISDYNDGRFPKLKNAKSDTDKIRAKLIDLGFDVWPKTISEKLTQREFTDNLYDYTEHVKKIKGVNLIYFAGHGLAFGGQNYLVPSDASPQYSRDVPNQLIATDLLAQAVTQMGASFNIVMLDACRNIALTNLPVFGMAQTIEVRPGAGFQSHERYVLSRSADDGQLARDGEDTSPYAEAILLALDQPNQDVYETFNHVAEYFSFLKLNEGPTPQEPTYSTKGGGYFYFRSTLDTFNRENAEWQRVSAKQAGGGVQFASFLTGYPAGYFAAEARKRLQAAQAGAAADVFGHVDLPSTRVSTDAVAAPPLALHGAAPPSASPAGLIPAAGAWSNSKPVSAIPQISITGARIAADPVDTRKITLVQSTGDAVRIRATPSQSGGVIKTVQKADQLIPLKTAEDAPRGWVRVLDGSGETGYVSSDWLRSADVPETVLKSAFAKGSDAAPRDLTTALAGLRDKFIATLRVAVYGGEDPSLDVSRLLSVFSAISRNNIRYVTITPVIVPPDSTHPVDTVQISAAYASNSNFRALVAAQPDQAPRTPK